MARTPWIIAALLLVLAPARAAETVTSRERPEVDPLGMRLGVWHLDASVALGYLLDDNIFATDAAEVDDDILLIVPQAVLASGWGRHSLRIGADATLARYSEYDGEDYEDSRLFADGRLDHAHGDVSASVSRSDLHDERTSPDDLRGLEPTTYTATDATLAWTWRPGVLLVRPDLRYRALSFDDTPTAAPDDPDDRAGGCVPTQVPGLDTCSNADRDRDVLDAGLRIGYEMSAEYDLFLEGRVTTVDYDQSVDFDGFERSSDGFEAVAGSTFDLGGTLFGEIYAGYRRWTFDDPRFATIDGPAFGADLTWNPTQLTTLRLTGDRTIESTTIVGAAGIERTAIGLTADHELLRNLLLWAEARIATEDFQGIDRDDDLRDFGVGAKYLMNRRLHVVIGYGNEQRDSSGSDSSGQEYDIDRIELRLEVNL